MNIESLRIKAEEARILYNSNLITRDEAKEIIQPYLDEVNKKSIELAKKYGRKPMKVSFISYCR